MHVVFLTQYFPPELGAAPNRLRAATEAFARRGHRVTVLTAMPSYPAGKIFPGYGGVFRREVMDGIAVLRSWVIPTQSSGMIRRLSNYFSFLFSAAIAGTLALRRADVLIVESPPLFLGITAVWLSWVKGARLIFNASDLWPESAAALGLIERESVAYRLSAWLEGFCYRQSWVVTGQAQGIVDDIKTRFPGVPVRLVSNGVNTEVFRPDLTPAAGFRRDGSCVAMYAGLHGLAQGLSQVVDAAARLPAESRLRVVLIGDGPEKAQLQTAARQKGLDRVEFLDSRPHRDMPALVAAADIVIIPLLREIPGAVPSKLYEAMAAGRALVLVAAGEPARIVETHRVGLVVSPGDIEGLASALSRLERDPALRSELGSRGRQAAERYFDRRRIAGEFVQDVEARLTSREWNSTPE